MKFPCTLDSPGFYVINEWLMNEDAEELKEQVSLSGGLSKEITMEAILGLSSQSEGDILVIANYSAMMTIRQK